MSERIAIKHFDLSHEKDIETKEAFLELGDIYLRYCSRHKSMVPVDSDDLAQGWKENIHDFDIRIKRINLVSVEKNWKHSMGHWGIDIEANGYPQTISIFYQEENKKEMETVFTKLSFYIFKC